MESYSGICGFCGLKTSKTTNGKAAQKMLKEHYQKNHLYECAENRIRKWDEIGCLKCSYPIDTAEKLENYRKCPNCGYDMGNWLAGMMAFASEYETWSE